MEYFKIKGLNIKQDRSRQLISVDCMLLENFITINQKSKNLLEIGCGCGIISLLLMKRTTAKINVIDIDKTMCELTESNFLENKDKLVTNSINIICNDFNKEKFFNDNFDIIYTNPPYFKLNNNQHKKNQNLKNARVEYLLSINDIISKSSKLLKNGGKFYCVFRADRLDEILELSNSFNLTPKRLQFVFTNQKYAKFILLECIKNANPGILIEYPIYLFDKGVATEFLKKLYD